MDVGGYLEARDDLDPEEEDEEEEEDGVAS